MSATLITDSVDDAASIIRDGGTVAFPTETVYGLGADCWNADAVRKVFLAKGRPADNPTIVHIAETSWLPSVSDSVSELASSILAAFAPGPVTVVVSRIAGLPDVVTAGLPTVGIRVPAHAVAQRFLRAVGSPVAAPSANVSGRPSPTNWRAVVADLDGRIDCILKGATSVVGLESTVVDCTGEYATILRPGSITLEDLAGVLGADRIRVASGRDSAIEVGASKVVASPGTRHRHYAPDAHVLVVQPGQPTDLAIPDATTVSSHDRRAPLRDADAATGLSAFIGLETPDDREQHAYVLICASVGEYARELYAFFRECESMGVATIYCESVEERGLGAALMDRLRRAQSATAPSPAETRPDTRGSGR